MQVGFVVCYIGFCNFVVLWVPRVCGFKPLCVFGFEFLCLCLGYLCWLCLRVLVCLCCSVTGFYRLVRGSGVFV